MAAAPARLAQARAIALVAPAALLAGAYGFQYLGGLVACEMCWWQRYALFGALDAGAAGVHRAAPPVG